MSKQQNICLSEKNSILQTTLFHETERPAFKNPFSWQTVADVLNSLPLGVCACKTVHDAKMYVYCFVLFLFVFIVAGIGEGGAV